MTTESIPIKENILLQLAYSSVRGLVHSGHDKKHGSLQADTVMEKELRILRQQKETVCHFRQSLNIGDLRSPLPQ